MKNYTSPEMYLLNLTAEDIITTSITGAPDVNLGSDTPVVDTDVNDNTDSGNGSVAYN